ncbi:MAG: glycosyltransferase family 9 protein [Armatimonadetes bacterium]|nr:glycosyltransferase family 9 protein [Armatimonadota bacterium]
MRFATKRRLDFLVGEPVCVVLNLLARLLGRLLHRDHALRSDFRCIYVVKLLGLGSVVNATPLLRALRGAYPRARLLFVGFEGLGALLDRLPLVDDRVLLRDRSLWLLAWDAVRLFVRAWRERPELVIDLEVHARASTILTTLTAARNRAGFTHSTAMFRSGLYTHLLYFNRWAHIADCYLQLGRLLGADSDDTRLEPPRLLDRDQAEVEEYLAGRRVGEAFLAVNANVGELCEERRWPPERFSRAVEELLELGLGPLVLIGAPSETALNQRVIDGVREELREQVHQAAGALTLGGTLALLARARLLLTNDSGPLHLAAALGTPTVSLWGPGLPQTFRPRHGHHRVIFHGVYCSPCLYLVDTVPCNGDNLCMQSIAWQTVVHQVLDLLGDPRAASYSDPGGPSGSTYFAGEMARWVARPSRTEQPGGRPSSEREVPDEG